MGKLNPENTQKIMEFVQLVTELADDDKEFLINAIVSSKKGLKRIELEGMKRLIGKMRQTPTIERMIERVCDSLKDDIGGNEAAPHEYLQHSIRIKMFLEATIAMKALEEVIMVCDGGEEISKNFSFTINNFLKVSDSIKNDLRLFYDLAEKKAKIGKPIEMRRGENATYGEAILSMENIPREGRPSQKKPWEDETAFTESEAMIEKLPKKLKI